jgi:hypothetical protein
VKEESGGDCSLSVHIDVRYHGSVRPGREKIRVCLQKKALSDHGRGGILMVPGHEEVVGPGGTAS